MSTNSLLVRFRMQTAYRLNKLLENMDLHDLSVITSDISNKDNHNVEATIQKGISSEASQEIRS